MQAKVVMVMDWKRTLAMWAGTDAFKSKLHEAERIIDEALATHDKPYVAYSGGKDSSCMLHLVLRRCPDIMVLHWDYGPYYIPDWLRSEFIENAKKIGAVNLRIETSKDYLRLKRHAINVLGREYMGKLIPSLASEGYDLCFVGLRREESLKRRRRIDAKKSITEIPECWPLANWSWRDVWAYIFAKNIPYASIYDIYAPVVGWDKARLVTFFDPEFNHLGASNLDGVLMWKFKNMQ